MSVRDRYDPGGAAAVREQTYRARQVQEHTQADLAARVIRGALESPLRYVPGTFQQAVMDAYFAEQHDRGMDS